MEVYQWTSTKTHFRALTVVHLVPVPAEGAERPERGSAQALTCSMPNILTLSMPIDTEEPRKAGRPAKAVECAGEDRGGVATAAQRGHRRGCVSGDRRTRTSRVVAR